MLVVVVEDGVVKSIRLVIVVVRAGYRGCDVLGRLELARVTGGTVVVLITGRRFPRVKGLVGGLR